MTKGMTATLLTVLAMAALPAAMTPVARAEVCGDVGGRHGDIGGCSNVGGDIADAAVIGDVDHPYGYPAPYPVPMAPPIGYPPLPPGYLLYPSFPGEMPCYTATGQPYYTPADTPCYPL